MTFNLWYSSVILEDFAMSFACAIVATLCSATN